MPDITMCFAKNCNIKEHCYRFTAKPDKFQSYSDFSELCCSNRNRTNVKYAYFLTQDKELLNMENKKLAREEYKERFNELFSKFYYIPQKDEEIVQCSYPNPDYWFTSNKGYLFSVEQNELLMLNPQCLKVCLAKNE